MSIVDKIPIMFVSSLYRYVVTFFSVANTLHSSCQFVSLLGTIGLLDLDVFIQVELRLFILLIIILSRFKLDTNQKLIRCVVSCFVQLLTTTPVTFCVFELITRIQLVDSYLNVSNLRDKKSRHPIFYRCELLTTGIL